MSEAKPMDKESAEQFDFLDRVWCIDEDARKVWKILRKNGVTEREIMDFVIVMNAYYRFSDKQLYDEIIGLSNQIGSLLFQLKIRGEMGKSG